MLQPRSHEIATTSCSKFQGDLIDSNGAGQVGCICSHQKYLQGTTGLTQNCKRHRHPRPTHTQSLCGWAGTGQDLTLIPHRSAVGIRSQTSKQQGFRWRQRGEGVREYSRRWCRGRTRGCCRRRWRSCPRTRRSAPSSPPGAAAAEAMWAPPSPTSSHRGWRGRWGSGHRVGRRAPGGACGWAQRPPHSAAASHSGLVIHSHATASNPLQHLNIRPYPSTQQLNNIEVVII